MDEFEVIIGDVLTLPIPPDMIAELEARFGPKLIGLRVGIVRGEDGRPSFVVGRLI